MVPEEASIMGEFISSGIAIGFAVGVTVALIARKHPLTRKHPNMIGIAAAGTADAISRDYRRPVIYDKLLKLDTPLASKGKEVLFGLRSGGTLMDKNESEPIPPSNPIDRAITNVDAQRQHESVDGTCSWWSDHPETTDHSTDVTTPKSSRQLVMVSPLLGTRTWNDIRNESKSE